MTINITRSVKVWQNEVYDKFDDLNKAPGVVWLHKHAKFAGFMTSPITEDLDGNYSEATTKAFNSLQEILMFLEDGSKVWIYQLKYEPSTPVYAKVDLETGEPIILDEVEFTEPKFYLRYAII